MTFELNITAQREQHRNATLNPLGPGDASPGFFEGTLAGPFRGVARLGAKAAVPAGEGMTPILKPVARDIDQMFGTDVQGFLDDERRKNVEALMATQAVGRTLNQMELRGIEERVRRGLRELAVEDKQAFLGMSPPQRLSAAAQRAAQELIGEANLKKVRTALTIAAHDRIGTYLADQRAGGMDGLDALSRTLVFHSDGKSNFMSIETRANTVRANALRQMLDTFEATDPRFFGLFENKEGVRDLTLELFGQDSGNKLAKAGAKAWMESTDALRAQFNASGGDIGKLDNWGLPQHHSQMRVAKAGCDAWVNTILPMLDRSKYVKEDGASFTDAEMQMFLGKAWETIATNGINKLEPSAPRGSGMRANRNAESRQIHFKGPDDYLEYQAQFGEKDLYGVMVSHISGIAKDIALVETFGPNPDNAFKHFRDTMLQNEASANPRQLGKITERATKLDGLYDWVSGHTVPVANEWLARGFDTLRNWLVASRLGSAVVTSFSDEATLYLTAHANNLPEMQLLANELSAFNPANKAELRMARRAGLSLETLIGELNRFGQDNLGSTFSSKLATTTMRLSGLSAMTDARKRAFGVTMMDAIGQLTRDVDNLKKLDPSDNRILLSKGVTDADWQIWRLAQVENWNGTNSTMLTPEAVMRVDDAAIIGALGKDVNPARVRSEAMQKLLGAVLEETDVAVITPGAKERAMMGAGLQRGTWKGELTKSFFLFKSFPIAMISRHWMRGMGMQTSGGKAAYIASLMAGTTILGMASMQVNELLSGRDPKNMNPVDGKSGAKNWVAAMLKGGSLGIYGDFLFSESTQGQRGPLASALGPVASLAEEAINLTQGNLMQMARGDDTRFGAEAVKFIKGNTPGANLWYAKAALDRIIFHQFQEYFSPGYLAGIRSRARQEFGQEWWWEPGQYTPGRAPDLDRAVE